jgi:hypothetical protein
MRTQLVLGTAVLASLGAVTQYRHHRPLKHTFQSRSANTLSFVGSVASDPIPATLIGQHTTIADQSLMIRDPMVVDAAEFNSCPQAAPPCSATTGSATTGSATTGSATTGKWTFGSILKEAICRTSGCSAPPTSKEIQRIVDMWRGNLDTGVASGQHANPAVVNADTSLKLAMQYFESAWIFDSTYPVERFPVRLLAVVNRLDLAQYDPAGCKADGDNGNDMRGAEIRFEFAAIEPAMQNDVPPPFDYLRFIVEFVLPCQSSKGAVSTTFNPAQFSFPQLAQDWYGLSRIQMAPAFPAALDKVLTKWISVSRNARIRIAAAAPGNDWAIREYSFDPQGNLSLGYLAREVSVEFDQCWGPGDPLGVFAKNNAAQIGASQYDIGDAGLASKEQAIHPSPPQPYVLTLAASVLPVPTLDTVRHSLSINTCRGCHSVETEITGGLHLGQRKKGTKSTISGFLSGNKSCDNSIDSGNTTDYCTVRPLPAKGCAVVPAEQAYNDLLRRDLYLDTVLNPPSDAPRGSSKWYLDLANYTARQKD